MNRSKLLAVVSLVAIIALVLRRRQGQSEQTDIEQPDDQEVDIEIQERSTS